MVVVAVEEATVEPQTGTMTIPEAIPAHMQVVETILQHIPMGMPT